jgi:nucleotide-binding universal stress UspA family protein
MRQILIATEGSPCSREAIHHFLETGIVGESEITVLTVIPVPASTGSQTERDARYLDEVATAQQALDNAVLDAAFSGTTVRTMSRVGDPADTIVLVAEELGANLIVLGTHGPEGLDRLAATGPDRRSVAEEVLHRAPCGVLIYPLRTGVQVGTAPVAV